MEHRPVSTARPRARDGRTHVAGKRGLGAFRTPQGVRGATCSTSSADLTSKEPTTPASEPRPGASGLRIRQLTPLPLPCAAVLLFALLLIALLTTTALASDPPPLGTPAPHADALWRIVSSCIDGEDGLSFCKCPAFNRSCCERTATPNADVVWAESADFVAIRNMSMCGCGGDFVAGLALPRARITGIEDPKRPDGIWPFAWDVARKHIPETSEIALVINPPEDRTQNQMHVHIVRLTPKGRAQIDTSTTGDDTIGLTLPDLRGVFTAAVEKLGPERIGGWGIIVTPWPAGGYRAVLVDEQSPESFTEHACALR